MAGRTDNTNGWKATGQNITSFEDGKIAISLDRDLNTIPAGISGANTGDLCIENLDNFDKSGDTMTDAQRETIVHLYACLCEKLGITPGPSTLVYHAWYTASGAWLGDYEAGKSSKTCPGTAFWGDGNTNSAALKGFIPAVATELNKLKSGEEEAMTAEEKKEFEELKAAIKERDVRIAALEARLNIDGKQTYASGYEQAVKAAKAAGAIKTSADKSKLELNMIQMLYNLGLFNKEAK
ncbi:N-acetylmuramoyl-L-alanine amidase [compost metagenome]